MRTACVLLLSALSLARVGTAEGGPLRAGAARIDITPGIRSENLLPVSYEVTASRLKPGCAEGAIVNGFLQLIERR